MIKSPLRYPGGKSKAVEFLSKFFPKGFKELREPMMGGASITFYWVQNRPSAKFLAGDINYDLFCFWKELKENKDKLIREIRRIKEQTKDGRQLFEDIMQRREKGDLDDSQRAVDFFVLNRITLLDLEGKDVIIFLDPPYYTSSASRLYGKKGNLHTNFDHMRFYKAVKKCNHKVLITYDNSDFIRNLYKDFYIVEWKLSYGMTNYKKDKVKVGSELLIANFPIQKYVERLTGTLLHRIVSY